MKKLSLEKQLYVMGWFMALLMIPAAIYLHFASNDQIGPCVFLAVFHVYCPGCGGTRAVWKLLEGHFLQALWYHPLVPYGALIYLLYMGSHTLNLLTKGKVPGMKFRPWYLWAALIIVIANVVLKNILLLGFGITLDSPIL